MVDKRMINGPIKKYTNFPLVLLVLFLVLFTLFDRAFISVGNIISILHNNTYIFIFCVGYAFVLTCGGLDLSAGMQISVVSTVAGILGYEEIPWLVVLVISLSIGVMCGAVNAFIIARMRVPYSFATLSTYIAFYGISHLISQGKSYWISPDSIRSVITGSFLFLPVDVWLVLLSLAVLSTIFNHTYLGSHIIAVGEDPRAAAESGVSVQNTKSLSILLGSFFFAIAALVYISKKGVSNLADGVDFFQITGFPGAYLAVTAAGKRGRIRKGSFLALRFWLGVCTLLMLENGVNMMEWGTELECIVTAFVLILATSQDYKNSQDYDNLHDATKT